MAERLEGNEDSDDYERVESNEIETNIKTVNVNQTTVYARNYVQVKDSKHVQITTGATDTHETNHPSFNSLHGRNILIDKEQGHTAKRVKGFKNGICFANNPFNGTSGIHFKIIETFEDSFGRCRMGFTNRDPKNLEGSGILSKGVETAKSSDGFVVIEPSMDTCAYEGAVIYFSYLKDVVTFSSSKDGVYQTFQCPNIFREEDDLWAFIELKGPVREVTLEKDSFHEVCGSVAQVTENVARLGWWTTIGYGGGMIVFTRNPVPHGRHAEYKLTKVNVNSAGHIRVGICKENPDLIRPDALPPTIVSHPLYLTIEVGREDARCGNIISLIPLGQHICILINSEKQIGIIKCDKDIAKTWAVVELFGKTNAVKIIRNSGTAQKCNVSERHLERRYITEITEQISFVTHVWLESQVVMNTLKAVADAIVYHLEGAGFGSYWNSALTPIETAAAYFGLDHYVQQAEIGDAPEILRTEIPFLVKSVTDLVSDIDKVKYSIGRLNSETLHPDQNELFKLLRSIAAGLPNFHLKLPGRSPMSPPPEDLLLNLSPLPVEPDILRDWHKLVVVKSLLEIANKIEAAFQVIDCLMRQLYACGI